MSDGRYLLFVWKPSGYEIREGEGELPSVGSEVEADTRTHAVAIALREAIID